MSKHRILRPLALALSLAVAAPLAVQAHGGHEGHGSQGDFRGGFHQKHEHGKHFGGHRGDFTHRLNLTEAQRDKVFELRHAAEPALRTKGKEIRAARHELRQLAMADKFDESRAVSLSNQAARAEAEHSLMRVRLANQIYSVLTPEQRKQAADLRKQRFERVKAAAAARTPAQ